MDRQRERAKLQQLREIVATLRGDDWQFDTSDFGTQIIIRRNDGVEVPLCRFGKRASSDEVRLVAGAVSHVEFLIGLIDRAADRVRTLEAELSQPAASSSAKDYAANAAMLCQNGAFQTYLSEVGFEPVADSIAADRVMKRLLGIDSKKLINSDDDARTAFLSFRSAYEAWLTGAGI